MTTNRIKRALEEYKEAVYVADSIAKDATRIRFEFLFYIEDSERGGCAVGAKASKVAVVMPFDQQTSRDVFMPTDRATELAFKGHTRDRLRCVMSVQLQNMTDTNTYEFDSGPLENGWMFFVDTTPRFSGGPNEPKRFTTPSAPREPFAISVRFASEKSMVLEKFKFTFAPDKHPELVKLLMEEAREARLNTALELVKKARKLDVNVAATD